MARTIFLILLLLNLVALAWIFTVGEQRNNAGREPQRVKAEQSADRIRIVVAATDDSLSAGAAASPPTPAASAPAAPTATSQVPAETCLAYAGASVSEAQQIAKTLAEKLPAARIAVNPVVPPSTFEIVIAGLASRPAAEIKLAELKRLGLDQGVTIRADDDKHFSLLIASFNQRPAAEDALKAASKKGVRSALVAEHKPAAEKAVIEVRGSDMALKKLPAQIAALKKLSPAACATP